MVTKIKHVVLAIGLAFGIGCAEGDGPGMELGHDDGALGEPTDDAFALAAAGEGAPEPEDDSTEADELTDKLGTTYCCTHMPATNRPCAQVSARTFRRAVRRCERNNPGSYPSKGSCSASWSHVCSNY